MCWRVSRGVLWVISQRKRFLFHFAKEPMSVKVLEVPIIMSLIIYIE